jgi:hypothetical protein
VLKILNIQYSDRQIKTSEFSISCVPSCCCAHCGEVCFVCRLVDDFASLGLEDNQNHNETSSSFDDEWTPQDFGSIVYLVIAANKYSEFQSRLSMDPRFGDPAGCSYYHTT